MSCAAAAPAWLAVGDGNGNWTVVNPVSVLDVTVEGVGNGPQDLAAASGFDASWRLRPGLPTNWTSGRVGATVPLGRNAIPVNGATRRTTSTGDTVTLP